MSNLEIEYKTLLTPKEYDRLLSQFAQVTPVNQTNHYIDSPDFIIKKKRMSLRIRTFDTAAEMTLKVPQEVGNLEHNQELTLEESRVLLSDFTVPAGPIKDLLSEAGIDQDKLRVLGSLTTLRYEMKTPIGLMALDKNTYADKTDYELEVEVSHAELGKKAFDTYLKDNRIIFKYASSKVARFAATLK